MIIMPRFDGQAACAETDPDAFFPEPGKEGQEVTRQAIKVCERCDVRQQCLQWALEHEEAGTWAGTTERQRQRLPKPAGKSRFRDINHGTEGGEKQHRRRGEAPCYECREGARRQRRERLGA